METPPTVIACYTLPDLPYADNALEPYIDALTMHIHRMKHHFSYISTLNAALSNPHLDLNPSSDLLTDLVTLQKNVVNLPTVIRNNGGGHFNHSLFWKVMAPIGTSNTHPTGSLKNAIDEVFGSFEAFQKQFTDAALQRFGSGWAWLGIPINNPLSRPLAICSTANQDNPLMSGLVDIEMIPVLGLDVWEHAYYLSYQNRRAEYVQNWWNVVNWDFVSDQYEEKVKKQPMSTSTSKAAVISLYRSALRVAFDFHFLEYRAWAVAIRHEFDTHRSVTDPQAINKLLEAGNELLHRHRHPEPYHYPNVGAAFERNSKIPDHICEHGFGKLVQP